ncbi:MAG: GntR family transcriptional regulator [Phycisphaeraceae bacterium]
MASRVTGTDYRPGQGPAQAAVLPVRRVYQALRQRVVEGEYQPGEKIPTEKELGDEFGVSRLTVAKAMAHLVAERRVERFRGRGTYVLRPEDGDKAEGADSRATEARRITFLSPGQEQGPVHIRHGILEGLHEALEAVGYYVGVDFYADLEQHLSKLEKLGEDRHAAAFVVWPEPDARTREKLTALIERRFPVVLVDTYLPDFACDYVVTDNVAGGALMVRHLADLGHRRITYITEWPDRTSLRNRLTGYLRGLVCEDVPVTERSVVTVDSWASADVGSVIDELFDAPEPPTAIFASHDYLAMNVHWALRERGLRVPEDISLAGYDNIDAAQHFAVPLTTVSQDYFQMGHVAGQILLERFGKPEPTVNYQQLIQPRLVERASTAAPPQRESTDKTKR